MSMPDMARLLDVPRSVVYKILRTSPGKEMLEVITLADRKRITRESFDRWYSSQTEYLKPEDQPKGVPRKYPTYQDSLTKKKVITTQGVKEVHLSGNPDYLTVSEAALMAKCNTARIYMWMKNERFPVLKLPGRVVRIPKEAFEEFLKKRKK